MRQTAINMVYELAKRNARLVLIEPSEEMRQILRTTSLDKVLEIR